MSVRLRTPVYFPRNFYSFQVHTSNNAVGLAIYRIAVKPSQLDTDPDR